MIVHRSNNKCAVLILLVGLVAIVAHAGNGQPLPHHIPVTLRENQLYIPVRINGRGPYYFRLDSDLSGFIRLDNRIAKELSLNIVGFQEITEGTQHKRVFLVGIDKVGIGPVSHTNLKARVGNFNEKDRPAVVDGMIGLDFFADYSVQIDGPAKQLIVLPDTAERSHREGLIYTKPYLIPGKIGGKAALMHVDVGSDVSVLFPTAMLSGIHHTDTDVQQTIRLANTSLVLREAIIQDKIELGGLTLTNQLIYHSDKVNQITIGMGFLKDHVIRIDARRNRLQIE